MGVPAIARQNLEHIAYRLVIPVKENRRNPDAFSENIPRGNCITAGGLATDVGNFQASCRLNE
jgi:hypothetical protein